MADRTLAKALALDLAEAVHKHARAHPQSGPAEALAALAFVAAGLIRKGATPSLTWDPIELRAFFADELASDLRAPQPETVDG